MAEEDGTIVGAAWSRIMNDYGHIDEDTPSLSIAFYPLYRSRGHGRILMSMLMKRLKEKGYEHVSLSVQKENYAIRLYESLGFTVVEDHPEECVMVCLL